MASYFTKWSIRSHNVLKYEETKGKVEKKTLFRLVKIDEVALGVTATIIDHRITNLSNLAAVVKPPIGRTPNTNNITNNRRNYNNSNNRNSITNNNNTNSKEAANINR